MYTNITAEQLIEEAASSGSFHLNAFQKIRNIDDDCPFLYVRDTIGHKFDQSDPDFMEEMRYIFDAADNNIYSNRSKYLRNLMLDKFGLKEG